VREGAALQDQLAAAKKKLDASSAPSVPPCKFPCPFTACFLLLIVCPCVGVAPPLSPNSLPPTPHPPTHNTLRPWSCPSERVQPYRTN
jgi:hypothetical protein